MRIDRRLSRKLATYASTSIALGGAVDVEAAVVHTSFGPSGVEIGPEFEMDLNADGEVDFWLRDMTQETREGCDVVVTTDDGGTYKTCSWGFFWFLRYGLHATGADENRILPDHDVHQRIGVAPADRFDPGSLISVDTPVFGTARAFVEGSIRCHTSADRCGGHSTGPQARFYLGMNFEIPGSGRHAAWADVEWFDMSNAPRLYAFAYESTAGNSIAAGDVGTPIDLTGDTDADGDVDLDDLNHVRNNFGGTGLGDTDDDNDVDLDDLNAVRNNFGAVGVQPVPEPPSLVLLAAGAAGLIAYRRRSRAIPTAAKTDNVHLR